MRRLSLGLLAALALQSVAGCGGNEPVLAPPPPLRPEAMEAEPVEEVRTDCKPTKPRDETSPLDYNERSIDEAQDRADMGVAKLREAEGADLPVQLREQKITEAVFDFVSSLQADPYNVRATYHLAAAYARIGRKVCALNLLERVIQMRGHHSRKDEVNKSLDKLLGRGAAYPDPDFNEMRNDDRFRALIRNMCADSKDPSCVRGR